MKNILLFAAVLFGIVLLSSCRKDFAESVQSAEDNSQVETEYSQIYDAVADYSASNSITGKTDDYILPSGAVVTFIDSIFTDGDGVDFTIDYGPLDHGASYKGILCKDGRYRAGKIRVGMTNKWSEVPDTLTISIPSSFDYYVGNGTNMYKLTGTKKIIRTTATSYSVSVTNASLQRDNGTITWDAERTITQTYDAGIGWYGDEYEITGNATGINVNGEAFTVVTTTPLRKKLALGCLSTFVAGKLELTNVVSGRTLGIDYDSYGNEACDKTVTVTYNGRTRTITLW